MGTRPHLIKLASIAKAFSNSDAEHSIIHTGQHYDDQLFTDFLIPLQLPKFSYIFEAGNKAPEDQFAYIISKVTKTLKEINPELVLVYGDTTSTSAGAIAASLCKVPIAHVEAGLREFTFTVPEECNKRITDSITSLFFCPSQVAVEQLLHEGISSECIRLTGDTGLDLLKWIPPKQVQTWVLDLKLQSKNYALCTFHREANTDDSNRLFSILDGLGQLEIEVLFPMHPRTSKAISLNGFTVPPNVSVLKPVGFFQLQEMVKHAKIVLTDSGGLTKEAYQHKKVVYLLDDQTEWVEAVAEGWVHVVGANTDAIARSIDSIQAPKVHSTPFGDGNGGQKVVKECLAFVCEIRKSSARPRSPYRRR